MRRPGGPVAESLSLITMPTARGFVAAAAGGIGAAALSLWLAPDMTGACGAGLALISAAIALTDARHMIIPNELNAAALALALVNAAVTAPDAVGGALVMAGLRGITTMSAFLVLRLAHQRLRGSEGLGLGDVKLAFVAGAWLDWPLIAVAVEIAAVAAILWFLSLRAAGTTSFDRAKRLPFGTFLAPAIWFAWLIAIVLP